MMDNTLPSFGLGDYLSNTTQLEDFLSTLDESGVRKVISNTNLLKQTNIGSTGNINKGGEESQLLSAKGSIQAGFSKMVYPSTSREFGLETQVENNDQIDCYGFQFTAGGTEPLHGISIIDDSQLMTGTGILLDAEMEEVPDLMPKLNVHLLAPYSRFRYSSEKIAGKGKRARHVEPEDIEKHCLLDLMVDNYEGPGKVVAYCVNEQGHLHPYNLHGENCNNGVYVKREKLRPNKVIRLANVSITTPKTKEYNTNLIGRHIYLEKVQREFGEVKKYNEIIDKQVVYVMVKVILEDSNNEVLSVMTQPIQNKKKGKEFKISDMKPVCAPANGHSGFNMQQNRILVVVTEETAFPKEVGVIVRDKVGPWAVKLTGKQIKVTKGAVVTFTPPPYKFPDIQEDVVVEICLFDVKTGAETEPVAFTYVTTKDVYGTKIKGKKRKLDENVHIDQSSVSLDNITIESRKILSAMRTKSSSSPKSVDVSSSESSSSAEDSQNNVIIISIDEESHQQLTSLSGSQDRDVSVRQAQDHLLHVSQLPLSSYADAHTGTGSSAIDATSAQTENYSRNCAEFEEGPFTLQQFVKEETNHCKPGQTSPVVTSSQSVFTSSIHDVYQNSSLSLMASSQMSDVLSTITQQQHQDTQCQQGMNIFENTPENIRNILLFKNILPKLAPHQHLISINGQFVIVYDDTMEMASTAPNVQNSQQMPQNSQQMQQNSQQMPQNSQQMPQNSQQMPQNSQQMPQNSQQMPQNSQQMPQNSQQIPQNSQQTQSYQGSVLQAVAATTNTQTSQPHLVTSSAQPQTWLCPQTSASVARHQPASSMPSANSAPITTQQNHKAIVDILSSLSLEMQLHILQQLLTTPNQLQSVDVLQNP